MAISLISVAVRIVNVAAGNDQTEVDVLLGIQAAITPFLSTFAALVFGIDIETLKRLCKAHTYVCSKETIEEYPANIPSHTDSFNVNQKHLTTRQEHI